MTNDPPARHGRGETQTIRWSGCLLDEELCTWNNPQKIGGESPASPRDKQYLSMFRVEFFSCTVIRCLWWSPGTVCFLFCRLLPGACGSHTFGRSISQNIENNNYGTFTKKLRKGDSVVIPQTYNSIVPVPWSNFWRMWKRHDTLREA